ncbi:MAG TPA: hypothetical protein PLQ71_12410 [Nitrospira sp.]|nr:hypothetical protein [Rhodocyclaceae bacterium]HNG02682.1 hypothetical protein [Nitrospira sp.]
MPVNDALASEQWTRFQYCRDRGHLEFINKADKCEKFFAGDQWLQADLNALQLQRRPALTINKIISTLGTLFGEQIYNRSETIFRPASGATAETAEALTKVFKQISQNNQLPWARSELFADGVIRSRGFLDIRLDFTDSMQGEVRIENLNSKNVVIDPDAEEYDPDRWMDCFITKWVTPQDIAVLYSEDDAEYLKIKDGSSFPYGYDSIERVRDRFGGVLPLAGYYGVHEPHGIRRNVRLLERQYRRLDKQLHFVDVTSGDMRAIPQDWDRNRIAQVVEKARGRVSVTKKLVKRIRWTVTADNVVLHDDWSPYKHFTPVPYFPYFRYGRTIGLVENLLGPQELLNKTSSQELHVVNTTANSGWKLKAGALKNMSIEELEQKGATTGLVLELDDVAAAEKIQPNATPQGLDRLSYKAEEHIKTISNISDSMQGFDREDVAAKAIQAKQSRGSINMTKVMDNLERSDFLVARNVLDIVQEYYTEPRLLHITHDDLLQQPETLEVNTYDEALNEITNDLTIGEYSIIITSQPFRATLEDSQFEQGMAMREAGIQLPDDILIENSRLQRKSEIVKRLQAAQNSPEAQQKAQLEMRNMEAAVAVAEAEAQQKAADAQLKLAKTKSEIASIEQENARITLEAKFVDAEGGGAAEAAKMQVEGQKAGHKMDLEERQFQHKQSLAEREMALKEEGHAREQARADDMHEHQKVISSKQADAQAQATRQAALSAAFNQGESE